MVRLSFVPVALLLLLDCSLANGQWFGSQSRGLRRGRAQSHAAPAVPNRYRTPYPTSTRGMSIGVFSYPDYNYPRPGSFDPYRFDNYVYDPYRFGSFEAPDLLNDPYFRERHRYDSHFPGRRRSPLVMKTPQPEFAYPSPRNPYLYKGSKEALRNPSSKHPQTANAPRQLIASLSAMDDGEAWMEFLAPDRVSALIAQGDQAVLKELLSHYDGIVNSPALKPIATAPGFQATRQLLREHVDHAEELPPPPGDAIQWETLPPAQI